MALQSCPSAERLSLMNSGLLPEPAADEVAAHVVGCESCVRFLESLPSETLPNEHEFIDSLRHAAQVSVEFPASLLDLRRELLDLPQRSSTVSGQSSRTPLAFLSSERVENEARRLLDPPQADDELGRIGGHRVVKVLGQGGMGLVLLAEDLALQRLVALKVIQPRFATNSELVARFEREARATAAIRSDFVVSIFSVSAAQTPVGRVPFFTMEYLRGESLDARLARGPLPVEEAIQFGQQIATGLAAVHAKGLLHRDIKPANVWLEVCEGELAATRAKLLDFGLAYVGENVTKLTRFGSAIGTPAYMSPEQAAAKTELDARSDLFAFGTVLYEMLTGRQAFQAPTTISLLLALTQETPPAPLTLRPEIPESLSQLVMALLRKNPADRPDRTETVLGQLTTIAESLRSADSLPSAAESRRQLPREPDCPPQSDPPKTAATAARKVGAMLLLAAIGFAAWNGLMTIRVETPKGTLVIESEDEDVEVRITRHGATIVDRTKDRKLDLAVGEYGVELVNQVNGLKLSAEKITVTREGQPPIRITREKPPAISERGLKTPARPTTDKNSQAPPSAAIAYLIGEGHGRWRIQNGELWCAEPSGDTDDWLFVGHADWTDYDFTVRATSTEPLRNHGPGVFFRCPARRRATLVTFNVFKSSQDYLDEIDGVEWRSPWNDKALPVHEAKSLRDWSGQGHVIKVSVRGTNATVFVDGERVLVYDKLKHPQGYVGVRSHKEFPSRYRDPKVTAPDGRVLLDGWPELPPELIAVDELAMRRFATWALSREGLVIPSGGGEPIKSANELKDGAVPNFISFNMSGTMSQPLRDSDLEPFKDFPGVENALYVRLSSLTPAGIGRLGALLKGKRIGQLGLLDMPVGASAFKAPGGFAEIVSLTLQNVSANDDELVHLKNLPRLNTLNLRFNNITDRGLVHLAEMKTLRHLDLHHTNVTAAGIAKLQAALPDCEIGTSLPTAPKPK